MKLKLIIGYLSLLLIASCNQSQKPDKLTCHFLKASDSSQFRYLENENNYKQIKNSNIHFLKEYNDSNEIINIREYDTNSIEVFSYSKQYVRNNWPGKYITVINANYINKKKEIIKSYFFHSNVGLYFDFFEIDSVRNSLKEFEICIDNLPNSINTNPFQNISKIHSLDAIVKNEILNSFGKSKQKLKREYFFDINGNIVKKIFYPNSVNEEKSIEINKYNSDNQLIYTNQNTLDSTSSELFYLYNKTIFAKENAKGNLILFTKLEYDWQLQQKIPCYITHYEYNNQNLIISEITYCKGMLDNKTTYSYDKQGRIIQKTYYNKENDSKKIFQYTYNTFGLIEQEINIEITSMHHVDTIYKYKPRYEYKYY